MIRSTSIRLRLHFSSPFRFSTSAVASPLADAVFPSSAGAPLTQESVLYVLNKLDRKPQQALSFFRSVTDQHRFVPGPPSYNLMLRILCCPDHLADFWAFLKSMRDAGHAIDQGTYFTLLASFKKNKLSRESNALSKYYHRTSKEATSEASVSAAATAILESENWNDEVGEKLDLIFSEATVSKILREVRDRPAKALDFFRWAERRSDYEHGSVAYNALIRVLAREESMGQFWSLIQEMKDKGHELDIDTYVKVSRHFIKHKMMNAAVELYELMMDGPYKPAIQDCGILLRKIALSGAPDLDLVHRVVRKYEAAGYSLSKVVYDGIHRSLTTIGKFDDAEEILERMKLDGYEPDNITYSQLVFGLCKAKRLEDARNVFDGMEVAGCIPDVKTWTVLIQGHFNAGEVDKAQELFAKMIEKNCEADGDVLDVMVRGLCSKNMADAGYRLLYEMVETAHVKPWQETYKFLIQQLLRSGMLEEALKILRLMKVHKFPPYSAPFPSYISRHGTIEDAKEFLKAVTMNNYPSPMVYLHVFQAFFEEGRYSEAQDLLFKCPHHVRKHSDISKLFGSIKTEKAS